MQLRLVSSQQKLTPFAVLPPEDFTGAAFFCNEPCSFQLALRGGNAGRGSHVSVCVTGMEDIAVYAEALVPIVTDATVGDAYPDGNGAPGLYPDPLLRRQAAPVIRARRAGTWGFFAEDGHNPPVRVYPDTWTGLWVTLNEAGKPIRPGDYPIRIVVTDLDTGAQAGETVFTAHAAAFSLPAPTVSYTNWFHWDCLCDTYGVELFSQRFWEMMETWVSSAARFGQTMLLLPAFTPPLDTPIGETRMTVQLVDVSRCGGTYTFGFDRLRRYIRTALRCGIRELEHCHFFSQWGAKGAPNIMATVDGRYQQLFGWDTPAGGAEYQSFLAAYLPAIRRVLDEEGVLEKTFFHISDEPQKEQLEAYRTASDVVRDGLRGLRCGDALSEYAYYEMGLVATPIAGLSSISDFAGRCDHFWGYYTGNPSDPEYANRLISYSNDRTRILGVKLYAYGAGGFLHWGYNYYYDVLSSGLFSPMLQPCGYKGMAGASFLAYPGPDGAPVPSIREKLMQEAMCDIRALQLLESNIGRAAVLALIREVFGEDVTSSTGSGDKTALLRLREAVLAKLLGRV